MKILNVSLDGFGRLTNQTFEFGSGFNLIFGLNETGKSTLQRAIVALLYGFYSSGRINSTDRAIVEAFRPWDKTMPYAGSLVYTLGNGHSYQIKRTFGDYATTSIYALPKTTDISNSFQKQTQGRVFIAEEHLGMPKEVFENTSYIRQAELIALESSASAITDTLMRLSASASSDNTAINAISLLQDTHKEQVGSLRARTKPLAQTHARLRELEEERNQFLAKRKDLASGLIEINQAKNQVSQLEQQIEKVRYLEAVATQAELQKKVDTVQQTVQDVADKAAEVIKWTDWAEFPGHLRDNVIKLFDRYQTLQQECQDTKISADKASEKLPDLTTKITSIKATIEELAEARSIRTEALTSIRDLASQWAITCQQTQAAEKRWQEAQANLTVLEQQFNDSQIRLEPIVKLGYAGLAQVKQQWGEAQKKVAETKEKLAKANQEWSKTGMTETQFIALAEQFHDFQIPKISTQPRKGCNLFASNRAAQSPVSTPTEFQIYKDLEPIYTALVTVRAEFKAAQEALKDIELNTCQRCGLQSQQPLNEHFFDELNQQLEQYHQLQTALNHENKTIVSLKAEVNQARQKEDTTKIALQTKLAELGFNTQDLRLAVDTYTQLVQKKTTLNQIETELRNLQLQAQTQEQIIKQWQQKLGQLTDITLQLKESLAQAGIKHHSDTPETLKAMLNDFEQSFVNHKRWLEAQQQHNLAERHLTTLENLENLENLLAGLDNQLTQMRNTQPQFAQLQASEPHHYYGTELKQLEVDLTKARNHLNEVQGTIGQSNNNLRHLAEIDEEINQAKTQLQKLEWYGAMLEQAQSQLTEATEEFQKQFAPKLESLINGGLNQITQGRYSDIHVDPKNLMVSVTAPELGRAVSAEYLSTGTHELVYLMLRVSVARLMSRTGEQLPLLLDDPLVQSDRKRQEQTLAFLGQLTEEMQVFLFTKEAWITDWFTQNLGNSSPHRMYILT